MEHVALEVGVLRVIRFLRVLKVLRIFWAFRFLDELRLLVSCMLGSMTSLLWSIMLIMVILLIAGLTFVDLVSQLQMDFPDKIAADANLKDMINVHFSSVGLAMLELFMSTTGGREWGPLYDVVKQSGLSAAISFVLYIVFFTFAFVNIISWSIELLAFDVATDVGVNDTAEEEKEIDGDHRQAGEEGGERRGREEGGR